MLQYIYSMICTMYLTALSLDMYKKTGKLGYSISLVITEMMTSNINESSSIGINQIVQL